MKTFVELMRISKTNFTIIFVVAFQRFHQLNETFYTQDQPSRGVLRKRCSENMQQIYRRPPMLKCDFNKVDLV